MVSFLVTMIMMAVITLIVVGFTQVANRNSREALDRQLSTQAFYAAESGVNVTDNTINSAPAGTILPTKTTCANDYSYSAPNGIGAPINELGGPGSGVSYSCVLVDPAPTSLVYNDITQDASTVIRVDSGGANFSSLNFTWSRKSGADTAGTCSGHPQAYYFPAASAWNCNFGILRLDIMQVPNPSAPPNTVDLMYNATDTLYLTPYGTNNGALTGSVNFAAGGTKGFYGSGCELNTTADTCAAPAVCNDSCTVKVNVSGASLYYVRATMLYQDAAKLTVQGKTDPAGDFVPLQNAQTMVDVTGKAQDELRRIQVRLSQDQSGSNSDLPLSALTSGQSICKRFTIAPGDTVATPADLCQ